MSVRACSRSFEFGVGHQVGYMPMGGIGDIYRGCSGESSIQAM
jgi:hypothetical protein